MACRALPLHKDACSYTAATQLVFNPLLELAHSLFLYRNISKVSKGIFLAREFFVSADS